MPKKSIGEFYRKVLSCVSVEPKTVGEIAEEAQTSWESTRKALELLEVIGVVSSVKEGEKKKYFKVISEGNENTFFRIPLSKRDNNLINFIFEKIKEIWKEKTGELPGKTVAQKILVEVNRRCNLNLPVGRYLYGMICPKPFDPYTTYEFHEPENAKGITECIRETVEKFSHLPIQQIKQQHYREMENKLYELKDDLIKSFPSSFTKDVLENITRKLLEMIIHLPNDREVVEAFVKYIEILNGLRNLENSKIENIRSDIIETFDKLWEFTAMKLFYIDLQKKYYPEQLENLRNSIEAQKLILREYFSSLRESVPSKKRQPTKGAEELKKLQGSVKEVKEISPEELEKLAKETAEDSKIFREFNLD